MPFLPSLPTRILRRATRAAATVVLRYPDRVACNVCGWHGRQFGSDVWHRHTVCWRCGSQVRHRLLAASLQQLEPFSAERLIRGKRVIHFAPEPAVSRAVRAGAAEYVTADLAARRGDLQLDISDMPKIPAGRFDLVVACDVLEHVADDRRALRELHRILAPGGTAVLTVPQGDELVATREDAAVVDPVERERRYGQPDHLRLYGADFVERVAAAGFEVAVVDEHSFAPGDAARHVLAPPERSAHPLATNFRRVFFARREADR